MTKPKRGRPPVDAPRSHQVALRLNEEERDLLQAVANDAGLELAAWMRMVALKEAKRLRR